MKKRIIALLLAFVIALGCCSPAFAKESKDETVNPLSQAGTSDLPFILIRGMNFSGLYYKMGTDKEQNCLGEIKAADIIKVVLKASTTAIFKRDWNVFADIACDYAKDLMGLMACDEKGNSKYDVSVQDYPLSAANYPELQNGETDEFGILHAACDIYGSDKVYYYNYDWRLDPLTHADKINKLVDQALKDSGKDKVNLVCASMGGIETISYMYKYGTEKLNRVIFLSSTFTGTHVTTDVLQGKIDFNSYYVYMYLRKLVAQNNKGLGLLMDALYKIKLFDGVCKFLNKTLAPNIIDEVYDYFLTDTFGTMPSVWALVLPEEYDACIKYMFEGKEDKYADFIALTKEYQKMTAQRDEMLYKAVEDGTSICVVAGYNSATVPVYVGGGSNGDSILEADRMLGKAKVAPLGTTLSNDKDAHLKNPKISFDNTVDLTNVLFPENTWAIRNGRHVGCNYGTDMSTFLFTLVNYKGTPTVSNVTGYNQFMDSSTGYDLMLVK